MGLVAKEGSSLDRQFFVRGAGYFGEMLQQHNGDMRSVCRKHRNEYIEYYRKPINGRVPSKEEEGIQLAVNGFHRAWFLSGMPTLIPDHKLAASLMSTSVPVELATDILPPWNSFMVVVPSGLISESETIVCVTMAKHLEETGEIEALGGYEPGTYFRAMIIIPGQHIQSIAGDFADLANFSGELNHDTLDKSESAVLTRRTVAAARLTIGVCCELDRRASTVSPNHAVKAKNSREHEAPKCWVTRVSRDVKVDCREALREYISCGRKKLSLQSLVRGHWKRQPFGDGSLDRKLIHVEPYWRGPEDAPIAVRSHVLNG
jgi:hypothetical protein